MSITMKREPFERRFSDMKAEAEYQMPLWKEIQSFINQVKGFFPGDTTSKSYKLDHKTMVDGAPMRYQDVAASGMMAGMTSPSRIWAKAQMEDPDLNSWEPVKYWLDIGNRIVFSIFEKAGIYNNLHSLYSEAVSFGEGAMGTFDSFKTVARGESFTIGQYYTALGPENTVESFAREFERTVDQLVKEFGIDNVSPTVQNSYRENRLGIKIKVCQLIEPNDDRIVDRQDFKNMPYRSVYWEEGSPSDTFLRVSGYHEFPMFVPRWDTISSSHVHGIGPGHKALGNAKSLQAYKKDSLKASAKMVDPPLQAPDSMKNSYAINAVPGGITFRPEETANGKIETLYNVNINHQFLQYNIDDIKQALREDFFVDVFLAMIQADRGQMTARQVSEIHDEKIIMLGPMFTRFTRELYNPLFTRTWNQCMRAGLFPPPPKEIQGQELKIEYISMLAQAQRMLGTSSIEQFTGYVGNLSAAFPEVLDKFDSDQAVEEYGDRLMIPPKLIRDDVKVAEIRQKRAQAQQQAAAAQNTMAMIQGAKLLSDTPVGNNSALDSLGNALGGGVPRG